MADEESKLTTGQHKFVHEAERFLRRVMNEGKTRGDVSAGASLKLYVDPQSKHLASIQPTLRRGRKPRMEYSVIVSPDKIGDWISIRHEAGHALLGHPERAGSSSLYWRRGDFESYIERELAADFHSRRLVRTLPDFFYDLANFTYVGVSDFALDFKTAFAMVRKGAIKAGVPHQHIKRAKRFLVERGEL